MRVTPTIRRVTLAPRQAEKKAVERVVEVEKPVYQTRLVDVKHRTYIRCNLRHADTRPHNAVIIFLTLCVIASALL